MATFINIGMRRRGTDAINVILELARTLAALSLQGMWSLGSRRCSQVMLEHGEEMTPS